MKWLIIAIKTVSIAVAVALVPTTAFSQMLQQINGLTFNQKTSARLATVTVSNLKRQSIATSNDLGMFSIKAAPGDTLLFLKPGFTERKILVTSSTDMVAYLLPAQQLQEVIVKAKTKQQEQKEVLDAYRSKGIYYNGKPPALSFLASPATAIYELFGKEPSRARHFAAQMKRENQQTEINRRYTFELVKRVTQLPDDEVQQFRLTYNPPYPEVLKWNEYEMIQFINRSLNGYNRAKTLPRLTPLTKKTGNSSTSRDSIYT
jgi:hypothetical protein